MILEDELEYWDNLDEDDDEAGADDNDDGPEVSEDDSFCSLYPPTSCLAILCCSLNCLKYIFIRKVFRKESLSLIIYYWIHLSYSG